MRSRPFAGKTRRARFGARNRRRSATCCGREERRPSARLGRISPNYYVQDGVIPRTRLPEMLDFIGSIEKKYDLHIGNIFHAGDGNLHPLIMYDERDREQTARVIKAAKEIIMRCVEMGGSITGEHGVGLEKSDLMPLIFSEDDLELMGRIKNLFNPQGRLNPGKLLPTGKMCGELRGGLAGRRRGVTLAVDSVRADLAALVGAVPRRCGPRCLRSFGGGRQGSGLRRRPRPRRNRWRRSCITPASIDLALIPRGNGTKLSTGNPPRRYDIALSLRELNRVIHYEPADLTISVEAGMTFGEFQDLVGQERFVAASRPARRGASPASAELSRRMRRGRCGRVSAARATWFWD